MSASIAKTEALPQAHEHGLWGRADSPPEWQITLEGASAGDPILVKDPSDPRDDFYLVPIHPKDPAATRSAWIMLDTVTFQLREAALLDNWKFPVFPDESDAKRISQNPLLLPDGTRAQFSPKDLKPNSKNLIWRASDASILPYWPLKEWIAAHPLTGEPVPIYETQEGEVLTCLTGITHPEAPASSPASGKSSLLPKVLSLVAGVVIGIAVHALWQSPQAGMITAERTKAASFKVEYERATELLTEEKERTAKLEGEIKSLTQQCAKGDAQAEQWKTQYDILVKSKELTDTNVEQWKRKYETLTKLKAETDKEVERWKLQVEGLTKLKIEMEATAEQLKRRVDSLTKLNEQAGADVEVWKRKFDALTKLKGEFEVRAEQYKRQVLILTKLKADADACVAERDIQIEVIRKKLAEFLTRKAGPKVTETTETPEENPQPTPVIPREGGPKELRKP